MKATMDNGGAFTSRLLERAGLSAGMRVLDVGCGPGDVAFRVADLVGPSGTVVGIDANPDAIAAANRRRDEAGRSGLGFEVADLHGVAADREPFDVVTCRRVLMYLPDRVAALRAMAKALKPGGHLVVQEHDEVPPLTSGELPLLSRAQGWVWDTVRSEGADTATGLHLPALLHEAGFQEPRVWCEAVVQTPDQPAPTAQIVAALMPRILAAGVATEDEVGIDTLEARLEAERGSAHATFIGELMFGAVARKR